MGPYSHWGLDHSRPSRFQHQTKGGDPTRSSRSEKKEDRSMNTSHGHHIPGTIQNEDTVSKARCGGVNICAKCKEEAVKVLPDDSIARASLLNDLDALVVTEAKSIPIEIYRKPINNFGAMQFLGGEDTAFDIISWLPPHGIQVTCCPPLEGVKVGGSATAERIEYVISNPVGVEKVYVGDWLTHGFVGLWNRDDELEFKVVPQGHFERQFEPACSLTPVPWQVPEEALVDYEKTIQTERL